MPLAIMPGSYGVPMIHKIEGIMKTCNKCDNKFPIRLKHLRWNGITTFRCTLCDTIYSTGQNYNKEDLEFEICDDKAKLVNVISFVEWSI